MKELYFNEVDFARRKEEWSAMSWRLVEEEAMAFKKQMGEMLLEQKFAESIGARSYQRSAQRRGYRGGHYRRSIQLKSGRIEGIRVPKSTGIRWLNPLMKRFERKSEEFEEMVYQGFMRGMSCRGLRGYWDQFCDADVISEQGVSDIVKKYTKAVEAWHRREIGGKYRWIYWDGKWVKIRGSSRKKVVLKVMGVKETGECELIDFRIASSESGIHWSELAQSLYNRGLTCKETELFICDGAKGLIEVLTWIWPDVAKQRCKVHHMRNVSKRVRKRNRKQFMKEAAKVYTARNLEQAEMKVEKFGQKWRKEEPDGVKAFLRDIESTLTFYRIGWEKGYGQKDRQDIGRVISSTNVLERQIEEDVRRIRSIRSFRNNESCHRIFYALSIMFNKNPWRIPVLLRKQKSEKILT